MTAYLKARRHRAARQALVLALLLATVARGLVPVGFMPMAVAGHAQMMFCSGHMDGAGARQEAPDPAAPASHDSPCAYAVGAGGAPLPVLPTLAPATSPVVGLVVAAVAQRVGPSGPPRAQSSRAPPRFS